MSNKDDLEAIGISNKPENKAENTSNINNVARIIKTLGILVFIGGLIIGFRFIDKVDELFVVFIVVGVVSSIFIYSLGEIIQLLQDIKDKK